ncbi:DUF968 domain-containing protein, partial [Escherichia coli]|uniref:DUF968 domain-containing protein n=1 Tax=Escherichia coli TaxID=562 RepID=UPI00207BE3FC
KTSIFSHPVYLFLRKFSLQDSRGGSHHLIGHGQGGMGTKAHDLFVLPLCRKHHDELHADTVAFEEMYGSQLELIFRFIDRALAIGVLA